MTWNIPTPIARQAAAADLWLELTGRKQASAGAVAQEAMAKVADARPVLGPGREAKRGLIGGAVLGAGLAGLAARHSVPAVHVGKAALGGGVVGGAAGGAAGIVQGVRRLVREAQSPEKQASAYDSIRAAVSKSPGTRAAVGAAAVGLPLAGIGYALELQRHTPGPDGTSPHRALTKLDLERHQAQGGAGHAPGGRLRGLYLGLRDQAAADASQTPRRSAALGSLAYAVPGAVTGAALGSRILR